MKHGALSLASVALACVIACGGSSTDASAPTSTRSAPDASWVDPPAPEPVDAGPAVDSGACPPPVVDYAPGTYLPPRAPRSDSACVADQTTALIDSCELRPCGGVAPTDIGCFDCLFGRDTDATFGLRVYSPQANTNLLNVRGVALRAGAPDACAAALEDYEGCMTRACACTTQIGRGAAPCLKKARAGACKAFDDGAASACTGPGAAAAALVRPAIETGAFATESDAVAAAKSLCGGT